MIDVRNVITGWMVGGRMFKQFIQSIRSLQAIYDFRKTSWGKVIVYYLLLVFIISFPLNLQMVRNKGLQIDGERLQIKSMMTKDFREELPEDCYIMPTYGFSCTETKNVTIDAGELTIVFHADPSYEAPDNSLVFYRDRMVFTKDNVQEESSYVDYKNIHFTDLKREKFETVKDRLVSGFKESFEAIDILNGVLLITGTNLLMNTIYIAIASSLAMLMKYGHVQFLKYKEIVKMFIYASTIPTMIAFLLGFFKLHGFIPVIYQFGTPLMFLLVYYKKIVPDLHQKNKEEREKQHQALLKEAESKTDD